MYKVPNSIMQKLNKNNINEFYSYQEKSFEKIDDDKNVIISSPTGTGKTLSFILPFLDRNYKKPYEVVILTPNDDLGGQINRVVNQYKDSFIKSNFIPGDITIQRKKSYLDRKPHILITTVKQFTKMIKYREINVQNIKSLVIDEFDQLTKDSYFGNIKTIFQEIKNSSQKIIAGATLNKKDIDKAIKLVKNNYKVIENIEGNIKHEGYYLIKNYKRDDSAFSILKKYKNKNLIMFFNKKETMEILANKMKEHGLEPYIFNADLKKQDKHNILRQIEKDDNFIIFSTDSLARGIDIKKLELVINFEIPFDKKQYIHRIGRISRGSSIGTAITLITKEKEQIFKEHYSNKVLLMN
ncbi:MAG: DEAD/DEAH box helicase [Mollicutes bacterium PWAP]|nr:DEAD/DEAH box helicase [Mollicutes bacterium PWAP]